MIKGNELQEHNEPKGRNDLSNLDLGQLMMEGHAHGLFAQSKGGMSSNHEDIGKLDIPPLGYGWGEGLQAEFSKHPHHHHHHHHSHAYDQPSQSQSDTATETALLANEIQMISFASQLLQQVARDLTAGSAPCPSTNGGDAVPPASTGDTPARGKSATPTDASSALAGFQIPSDKLKGPVITPDFSGGNDTQAINNAVSQAAAKGGGVVHIPAGVYNIDAANAGIIMKDNVSLVMDKGTILQGHSNGAESGCIIDIRNANNVNIYGGKLVGDFGPGASHFGETMSGIDVLGTSSNIDIQGVESDNNKGDGFDINGKGDNIHLAHNVAIGNKRDALSIEGGNHVVIEYNAFLNTGTKDSYDNHFSGGLERLPNSAIDVENNPGQSVNGAIIRNNLLAGAGTKGIDENTSNGWGIRVTGGDDNGTQVLDNTITGNVAGGVGVWSGSGNIVDGNIIENQPNPYKLFGGSATGGNTTSPTI